MTLDELSEMVLEISPHLVDPCEGAALVESCGINDEVAQSDFGMADTFAVGHYLLDLSRTKKSSMVLEVKEKPSFGFLEEARIATHKMSVNLAYALPWTLLLTAEYVNPRLLQLSPEWGGTLSIALIASLVCAGGFSQAIIRIGYFYTGMKEPKLASKVCLLFLKCGCFVCGGIAAVGFVVADHFGIFAPIYLASGCLAFLIFSALWMFCAMLSLQKRVWRIPLVFVVGGIIFSLVRPVLGVIPSLFIANAATMGAAAVFSASGFRLLPHSGSISAPSPHLPRLPVIAFRLLPTFVYGVLYFAFLFADRIAAGSAVPWASGLSFGIDLHYKQGMDAALVIFLVLAAIVEYLADRFMRHWFRISESARDIRPLLKSTYRRSLVVVCIFSALLVSGVWYVIGYVHHELLLTTALGSFGYVFLALALFNLILLLSVNSVIRALQVTTVALVCNALTGYVFSHSLGVEFAALGLLVGGLVLFILSYCAIRFVLEKADYFYVLA